MAASKFEALVDEAVSGGNTSDEDAGPQRFSGMRRVAAVAVLGGALVVAVWGHGAGFRTPTVNEKAVQEQVGLGDIQGALNNAAEQVTGLAAPHVETLKHHAGSAQAAASKHIEAAKNLVAKNSGAAGSALQPITDAASKQVDAAKAAFGAGGSGATCGGLPCSAGTCCGVMCCSGGCDSSGMVCKLPGMNGATDKLAAQASTAADFDSVKNTAEQQYNNAKNVAQQQIDKAKNTMDQMNRCGGVVPCPTGECCGAFCCKHGCDSMGSACKLNHNPGHCGLLPCESGTCCGAGDILCCSNGCDSSGFFCA